MASSKPSSSHHYYEHIPPPKVRSKSSDPISVKNESSSKAKKTPKMKKSLTTLTGFETKATSALVPTTCLSQSPLRRRFSLFRIKRSHPNPDTCHIQTLEQIIDQLRHDLQLKTTELERVKERLEGKRHHLVQPSNESIEQAMQLQTMLNTKLEEMLLENDLLKQSIHELESFVQQETGKELSRNCATLK